MSEKIILNLKHHRRLAGFNQSDFPYTQAYISRVESGISAPGTDVARKLAKFYGLSLRGFWESWEKSKEDTAIEKGIIDDESTQTEPQE